MSRHVAHIHRVPWPVWALRVGPVGWVYPKPGYIHGIMVVEHEPGVGELCLLDRPCTPDQYRAALRAMRQEGFTHHVTERHDDDGTIRRIVRRIK